MENPKIYTLKEAVARTGYNLHYFRRKCKSGAFEHTKEGPHILFTPEQFSKLPIIKLSAPEKKSGASVSIFDGLDQE